MQAGDGHRRLALAVDFGQFRTEDVERPACRRIGATVDDGAQIAGVGVVNLRRGDQSK